MIRTLTLVCLLTLLAGLAIGVFVAHATSWVTVDEWPTVPPSVPPRALDEKVSLYKTAYGLEDREAAEVRRVLREYEEAVAAELKRLRQAHPEKFVELRGAANARLKKVTDAARDRKAASPAR